MVMVFHLKENEMSDKKFVFTTKKEKDWLIGLLRSEIVELTFTKKDGTERIMKCTNIYFTLGSLKNA